MSKYHAKRTEVDGIVFDSRGEARRWVDLQLLEHAGMITELRRQVKYKLEVNGLKVCDYVADYTYFERGRYVVEDFKSPATRTPVYRLKRKLMFALLGIEIFETGA